MVPVDGSYTMEQASMVEVLKLLKARLILPMHYFGLDTLQRFLAYLGESFEVEMARKPEITVSVRTLPQSPRIAVVPGPGMHWHAILPTQVRAGEYFGFATTMLLASGLPAGPVLAVTSFEGLERYRPGSEVLEYRRSTAAVEACGTT